MKLRRLDEGNLTNFLLEEQFKESVRATLRSDNKIPMSKSIEIIMDKTISLKDLLFKNLEI